MEPAYEHDHDGCIFLGQDSPHPGEPKCNVVDLYICIRGRKPSDYALIRRYSSEGSNYGCVTVGLPSLGRYALNIELAKSRGII